MSPDPVGGDIILNMLRSVLSINGRSHLAAKVQGYRMLQNCYLICLSIPDFPFMLISIKCFIYLTRIHKIPKTTSRFLIFCTCCSLGSSCCLRYSFCLVKSAIFLFCSSNLFRLLWLLCRTLSFHSISIWNCFLTLSLFSFR